MAMTTSDGDKVPINANSGALISRWFDHANDDETSGHWVAFLDRGEQSVIVATGE
jgi:hypothetical protein